MRTRLVLIVLLGLLAGLGAEPVAAQVPLLPGGGGRGVQSPFVKAAATRWEYRLLDRDALGEMGSTKLADGLNKLGEEGWELAAIAPAGQRLEYYFKRPKRGKLGPPPAPKDEAKEEAKDGTTSSLERAREVTSIFALKHAKAVETTNMLLELFSSRGGRDVRIAADQRTNSLVVMGPASTVMAIEAVVRRLDETEAQGK